VDMGLIGGEMIQLGNRLVTVVASPGHSPGHLSLWDEQTRSLLVGDAVLGSGRPAGGRQPGVPAYLSIR
jgi:glyoxylase-like metal-dependent hydrolase (beta-lactamase superfamily II)